jgi:acyl dehydratase
MNVHEQPSASIEEMRARAGQEVGVSPWHAVTQDMIDRFAEVTDDHQFIHTDPVRAKAETPFGGTIAHGFLTLSLLSLLAREALPRLKDRAMGINYGFDRVRFMAPVKSGARVRGRFTLTEVVDRAEKLVMFRYAVSIEIEGGAKPALTADWLTLAVVE